MSAFDSRKTPLTRRTRQMNLGMRVKAWSRLYRIYARSQVRADITSPWFTNRDDGLGRSRCSYSGKQNIWYMNGVMLAPVRTWPISACRARFFAQFSSNHCNLAYSALGSFRIGMSGSASGSAVGRKFISDSEDRSRLGRRGGRTQSLKDREKSRRRCRCK